jgi:hypothetical protein
MMQDKDFYLKQIRKSPVAFKIKNLALEMFAAWQEHMKYRDPEASFKAESKQIIHDVEDCFARSLAALCDDGSQRIGSSWEMGFIYGFVQSSASSFWCHEYIYSKTEEYKQLMLFKSIFTYLQIDDLATEKIEKLYKHLIGEEVSLQKEKNEQKIISLAAFKKYHKKGGHDNEFYSFLKSSLSSIIIEKFDIALTQLSSGFDFEFENHLERDDMRFLMDCCE